MSDGQVVEARGLSKRYRGRTVVRDLSFAAQPGRVLGFLGPNGAGKSTTLRMMVGLVRPSAGTALFGGQPFSQLPNPLVSVGAALDGQSFIPGRSGRAHLRTVAVGAGISVSRVDEVLELVGLSQAAGRRVGGYSLGMRQRLGLATALLGDPGVLLLDEPVNGLDPEGIIWIRNFLRYLAGQGRTVILSSHLLSEVAQTVDDLVVIAGGELRFSGSLDELSSRARRHVLVSSSDDEALGRAFAANGWQVQPSRRGLYVEDHDAAEVGRLAFHHGVALSHLSDESAGLEQVFLELVGAPNEQAQHRAEGRQP